LLVAVVWLGAQTAVSIVFVVVRLADDPEAANSPRAMEALAEELKHDGLLLSLATWLASPAALAVVCLAIFVRKWPLGEYLALGKIPRRELAIGLAAMAVFIPLADGLTLLSGREIVPQFMVDAWNSARFLPFLIATLVIAAPVGEELVFRGFLYRGWAASRLGPAGAIVLISLLWSAIHLQYDLFQIAQIFAGGLLLGYLRWRSGSTLLTIVLHAVMNMVATIEAALVVS
jgi:hypothetical protein